MTSTPMQSPAGRSDGRMIRVSIVAALMLGSLIASAQPASEPLTSQEPAMNAAAAPPQSAPNPGERKFRANCSRCHNAPEQISPRIAGTVVRHMRIHASLSAQDERDILRYLAP